MTVGFDTVCTNLPQSRAEVASSNKRSVGFLTNARAIAILCVKMLLNTWIV